VTAAVIGAVAVVLAALIAAVVSVVLRRAPASKLELESISFPDDSRNPAPRLDPYEGAWFEIRSLDIDRGGLLDVVVRNKGDQPALIISAVVWVEDAVTIEASLLQHFTGGTLSELPSSERYEVGLPPPDSSRKSPTKIKLFQEVPKTGLERFQIVLRATNVDALELVVYRVRIGFEQREDKRTQALSSSILVCHPEDLATSIIPPMTYVITELSNFLEKYPREVQGALNELRRRREEVALANQLTEQQKQEAVAKYQEAITGYQVIRPQKYIKDYLDGLEHAYQSFERIGKAAKIKSPMAEIAYENCLNGLEEMQAVRARFLQSSADSK
jgi:hypothetical protein